MTALELFFDLVFVFAITQVTAFIYRDPTWLRLLAGVRDPDGALVRLERLRLAREHRGHRRAALIRVVLLAAMAPLLVASLAVPHAFGDDALVFGVAYFVVRGAAHRRATRAGARRPGAARGGHAARATMLPAARAARRRRARRRSRGEASAGRGDRDRLRRPGARAARGWRVEPGHFAERHGLIIIIALGESIVALGVGAAGLGLDAGVVVGALLGLAVAAALWWAYFDVVATVAERQAARGDAGARRPAIARDSYSYLHLPMVAGIVVFAFGVEEDARRTSTPTCRRPGGRALRRRRPLPARAERVQAPQHRLLQQAAARRRRRCSRRSRRSRRGAGAARARARRGRRVRADRVRGVPLRRGARAHPARSRLVHQAG